MKKGGKGWVKEKGYWKIRRNRKIKEDKKKGDEEKDNKRSRKEGGG